MSALNDPSQYYSCSRLSTLVKKKGDLLYLGILIECLDFQPLKKVQLKVVRGVSLNFQVCCLSYQRDAEI